jgi:glycosyltransferase involved in cell wall biosynthesis
MDTVSILIPCYNTEAYLAETIESALGQTWPNCEIIVVDDGSTDDSLEVARAYEGEKVSVIPQSNQGASAARNRALEASTGTYIQYLDADDLLHPRKVEAQITALEHSRPRTVAVCSTVYFRDGNPPESGERAKGEGDVPWLTSDDPVQWLINLWMPNKGWGMVQPGAWLVPREVVEAAGPWREDISLDDDGEFFTRALLASNRIRYVEDGCVYYRHHDDNARVSGSDSREAYEGLLRAIDSRRDHVLPRTTDSNRADAIFAIARSYWSIAVQTLPLYYDLASEAIDRARCLGVHEPPESVLPSTRKSQIVRRLGGWKVTRYLQYWYHHLISDAI